MFVVNERASFIPCSLSSSDENDDRDEEEDDHDDESEDDEESLGAERDATPTTPPFGFLQRC